MIIKVWFFESRQDFHTIMDSKLNKMEKWKFWGNANEVYGVATVVAVLAFFTTWQSLLLLPVLWMVFWVVHDMAMGYRLGAGVWHIGTSGFDAKMAATFQNSGKLYFAVKMFWLGLLITMYLFL
jgi:hypothetical protein